MRRLVTTIGLSLLLAGSAFAQQAEEKPDFSKDALRDFFAEGGVEREPPRSPFDFGFVFFDHPRARVRWMPFVAPLLLNLNSGSPDIDTSPMVDPFALTGTSFPTTPGQAKDRFRDWRERRALRRFVAKANAADGGR